MPSQKRKNWPADVVMKRTTTVQKCRKFRRLFQVFSDPPFLLQLASQTTREVAIRLKQRTARGEGGAKAKISKIRSIFLGPH
jgi:hypothetical protein